MIRVAELRQRRFCARQANHFRGRGHVPPRVSDVSRCAVACDRRAINVLGVAGTLTFSEHEERIHTVRQSQKKRKDEEGTCNHLCSCIRQTRLCTKWFQIRVESQEKSFKSLMDALPSVHFSFSHDDPDDMNRLLIVSNFVKLQTALRSSQVLVQH